MLHYVARGRPKTTWFEQEQEVVWDRKLRLSLILDVDDELDYDSFINIENI